MICRLQLNLRPQTVASEVSSGPQQVRVGWMIVSQPRAKPAKKRTYLLRIGVPLVLHEVLALLGYPHAEPEAIWLILVLTGYRIPDLAEPALRTPPQAVLGAFAEHTATLCLRFTSQPLVKLAMGL